MPCTVKHLKIAAKWRENNRDKVKTISREYLANNKEK